MLIDNKIFNGLNGLELPLRPTMLKSKDHCTLYSETRMSALLVIFTDQEGCDCSIGVLTTELHTVIFMFKNFLDFNIAGEGKGLGLLLASPDLDSWSLQVQLRV